MEILEKIQFEYNNYKKDLADVENAVFGLEFVNTVIAENKQLDGIVKNQIEKIKEKIKNDILKEKFGQMPKKAIKLKYMAGPEYTQKLQARLDENTELPEYTKAVTFADFNSEIAEKVKKEYYKLVSTNTVNKIEKEYRKTLTDLYDQIDIEGILEKYAGEIKKFAISEVQEYFLTLNDDYVYDRTYNYGYHYWDYEKKKLTAKNLDEFIESFLNECGYLDYELFEAGENADIIIDCLKEISLEYRRISDLSDSDEILHDCFCDTVIDKICYHDDYAYVNNLFTYDEIYDLLKRNSHYADIFAEYEQIKKAYEHSKEGLLNAIPETYPELFPLARTMTRRFVLHIGPTNSGKSYTALERLKTAKHGIYLAPLRLLALEKYEEIIEAGIPCSMVTGEEEIRTENARIQSSTIEILDFVQEYDIAVIDEAQMLQDKQRGSAWTMALLGIRAEEIHVCLSPDAKDAVIGIINSCNDTYEISEHERLTPLKFEDVKNEIFPENVQKGDAFIVFSRRDVHACAAELQKLGHKCSIIYGSLPYDVRRNEVKKYINGETDMVVATDAIGMGLNLPIKRIVFLRDAKFDGTEIRKLNYPEIKQIAGRAGRFGIYDEGIVATDVNTHLIKNALTVELKQVQDATIGFPRSLLGIDGTLSQLLTLWMGITPLPGYTTADLSDQIKLAQALELISNNKPLIYEFVNIPFDVKNNDLYRVWIDLFGEYLGSQEGEFVDIESYIKGNISNMSLADLENEFKLCDLLYHYSRKFGTAMQCENITEKKRKISEKIMFLLDEQKTEAKTCKYCGKPLPFKYQYGMCELLPDFR